MTGRGLRIERIEVPAETRWPDGRTNAYLVGDDRGVLVDPPSVTAELTAAVEEANPAHIAVTHTHDDHIGGVEAYAAATGAIVWTRAGRIGRFVEATGVEPDRTFTEGSEVGPVSVIETPGHAPDHVAFEAGGLALVGDLVVEPGSIFVGGRDGDLRAYLCSLRRLRQRDFTTLYPGHGLTIDSPNRTIERILAHRLERERRVLEAIEGGAGDIEAILDTAYDKDLSGVRDLARLTVAAHLEKLAVEDRIAWDGAHAEAR